MLGGWCRRGLHLVLLVAVCASLALPTVPAVATSDPADEQAVPEAVPDDVPDAEPDALSKAVEVALEAAARAWAKVTEVRAGGRRADQAVRNAEASIVPAVEARWDAEDRRDAAVVWVARAEHRRLRAEAEVAGRQLYRDRVRDDLAVARQQLEDRVVRSYKTGTMAAESTFALTLVRESRSPGELSAAIKHLEVVLHAGVGRVEDLIEALDVAETELADARTRLSVAETERRDAGAELEAALTDLGDATAEIDQAESLAAARRRLADDAEARLLTVLESALHAQEKALRAAEAEAEAADGDVAVLGITLPSGLDGDDGEATLEERRDWLAARERALQRARALDPAARRAAEGWSCPIPGGRFVNDWGFPRSHDRRHQGTDLFAPRGTAVHAPAAGVVAKLDAVDRFDGRRDLGGITVSVEQGRQRWYHAHLDGIHPDLEEGGEVEAGQVIGWVGRTGNAHGTVPHLHFGWYVDNVPVNAYVSLALACRDRDEDRLRGRP